MNGYGYAFQATKQLHRVLLYFVCCSVVALRIELSAIRLSDGYGLQPLTTITSSRAPRGRTEILLLPKQACSHLHLCPNRFVSGPAGS